MLASLINFGNILLPKSLILADFPRRHSIYSTVFTRFATVLASMVMPRYFVLLTLFTLFLIDGKLQAQSDLPISTAIRIGDTTQLHVLHLAAGDRLLGYVLSVEATAVRFRFRRAGTVNRFDREQVRYIGLPGEAPPRRSLSLPDSSYNRQGRYIVNVKEPYENLLFFRSALDSPTKSTYRNSMLLVNEFNLRAGKHFDVGGFAVVPSLIGLRMRYHTRIAENLHFGVASDNFFIYIEEPSGANLLYPIVTVGNAAQYLNYGVGYVFAYDSFNRGLNPFFCLGGSVQFAPRWRVMGNFFYLFRTFNDNSVLPQIMFTHNRFRHRYDFGVIPLFDATVPLVPAFSYSLYF